MASAHDTHIDELYALPPGEFTAARNEAARDDASLKTLPKPSAAAWALNNFARTHPKDLEQLFALGQELRDAQEDLDAGALRELGSQRRKLVGALAKQIADAASVSASAVADIEASLHAALADENAAAAIASGRLVRALSSTGVDAVDLEGAIAGEAPAAAKTKPDLGAARTEVAEDETALKDAQSAVAAADDELDANSEEQDHLRSDIEDLQARLDEAKAQLRDARSRGTFLASEHRRLEAEEKKAEAQAEKSRRRLARLETR